MSACDKTSMEIAWPSGADEQKAVQQAADKVDTGIVGGHGDIPMLLQHMEGPEDKLLLSWHLPGTGQEVQHGPIQAFV